MKKLGIALLSLVLMFTHAFALADDAAPAPDTGTQQGSPDSGSTAGDAEPDC